MSSSFVYCPHVRQSDGTIVTPDIAIDRVFASGAEGIVPVPVSRLTSAAALQRVADAPVGTPAVILVAASFGMLVSVGAILGDVLAMARTAWRYGDIGSGYGDIVLRSWTMRDGKRTPFVSETLADLPPPADILSGLGNSAGLKPGTAVFIGHPARLGESLPADRFEVALERAGTALTYGFDIEIVA
tara:strand:- start:18139 stop:18699 length:561 start_codon:yes stop_codon:yes gene_type:complete